MPPKEVKKKEPSNPPRGWAGRNPQAYHGLIAAFNYLTTMVGSLVGGYYLSRWLEKQWILWLAIAWGVFGGLFFLVKRLNWIEKRYGKKGGSSDS